ncbi:hypothetical protein PTKIN_Ptkin11bG0103400 [Pterospermum kingtungense]
MRLCHGTPTRRALSFRTVLNFSAFCFPLILSTITSPTSSGNLILMYVPFLLLFYGFFFLFFLHEFILMKIFDR